MYAYRIAHQADWPWLQQAAVAAAWESLSREEQARAALPEVATRSLGQLQSAVGAPGSLSLVATAGGQPVGFLLGSPGPDSTTDEMNGHILTVWIAPAHRRRGLARALMSAAEDYFARMGLRKVKVWTGLHNETALKLAAQRGYKSEGLIGRKLL